jgi:lipopolysaccharide transport system permease protein
VIDESPATTPATPAATPAAPAGAPAPAATAPNRVLLTPPSGWPTIGLAELWRYRELTWFLAWRDIKVRYKQTLLGFAWAIIQPVMNTLVFTIFFNKLAGIGKDEKLPYAVLTLCAILPWQLFENSITQAGNSLVGSQNLITKVYFPRLSIPISSILSGLPDFLIGLALLAGLMAWYHIRPGPALLALPLFIGLALALSLAVGLWLSAMNVQYRDVRYAIPFLARLWFFATPIVYPASIVGKWGPTWQALYGLNPMAGVVEGFRWSLLGPEGAAHRPGPLILVSAGMTLVLLLGGLVYFRRMEQTFADVV